VIAARISLQGHRQDVIPLLRIEGVDPSLFAPAIQNVSRVGHRLLTQPRGHCLVVCKAALMRSVPKGSALIVPRPVETQACSGVALASHSGGQRVTNGSIGVAKPDSLKETEQRRNGNLLTAGRGERQRYIAAQRVPSPVSQPALPECSGSKRRRGLVPHWHPGADSGTSPQIPNLSIPRTFPKVSDGTRTHDRLDHNALQGFL
jgi:hypothetical protein